jgi:hypothetical protein
MIEAEENVIVVVRVRPIQKSEESKGEQSCVESVSNGKEIQIKTGPLAAEVYKCNGVFPIETSQVIRYTYMYLYTYVDRYMYTLFHVCIYMYINVHMYRSLYI